MFRRLLIGLLAVVPAFGQADYCAERAGIALGELGVALGSAPAAEREASTRAVLEQLCRDAQGAAAAVESTPPRGEADKPESTTVLGVEIKEAPKGAPGYERASKGM